MTLLSLLSLSVQMTDSPWARYQPLAAQCREARLAVGTPAGFLCDLPDFLEPQQFREQAEEVGQVPADARRSRPNFSTQKLHAAFDTCACGGDETRRPHTHLKEAKNARLGIGRIVALYYRASALYSYSLT